MLRSSVSLCIIEVPAHSMTVKQCSRNLPQYRRAWLCPWKIMDCYLLPSVDYFLNIPSVTAKVLLS